MAIRDGSFSFSDGNSKLYLATQGAWVWFSHQDGNVGHVEEMWPKILKELSATLANFATTYPMIPSERSVLLSTVSEVHKNYQRTLLPVISTKRRVEYDLIYEEFNKALQLHKSNMPKLSLQRIEQAFKRSRSEICELAEIYVKAMENDSNTPQQLHELLKKFVKEDITAGRCPWLNKLAEDPSWLCSFYAQDLPKGIPQNLDLSGCPNYMILHVLENFQNRSINLKLDYFYNAQDITKSIIENLNLVSSIQRLDCFNMDANQISASELVLTMIKASDNSGSLKEVKLPRNLVSIHSNFIAHLSEPIRKQVLAQIEENIEYVRRRRPAPLPTIYPESFLELNEAL